jgi:hypothetical protein
MNDTFFLGTYPGLGKEQIAFTMNIIDEFLTPINGISKFTKLFLARKA